MVHSKQGVAVSISEESEGVDLKMKMKGMFGVMFD